MQESLSRICIGTDFSQAAERALRRALLLPLADRAEIHLVHVAPDEPARREAVTMLEQIVDDVRRDHALGGRLSLHTEVLVGAPYVELVRTSRRLDAELVVLGRKSPSAERRRRLRTTASHVVRKGDIAVLNVASDPEAPYRKPLVATELDDASRRVLDIGLRVVGSGVRAIDILHAYHVPFEHFVVPRPPQAGARGPYVHSFHDKAAAAMSALLGLYAGLPIEWNRIIVPGESRAAVFDALIARGSDLLVLGTHGRTGVAHTVLGSVAEELVATAPCDVLVARPVRFSFPSI